MQRHIYRFATVYTLLFSIQQKTPIEADAVESAAVVMALSLLADLSITLPLSLFFIEYLIPQFMILAARPALAPVISELQGQGQVVGDSHSAGRDYLAASDGDHRVGRAVTIGLRNALQRARSQLAGKRSAEIGDASLDEFVITRNPMMGSELCNSNMPTGEAFCSESDGSLKATEPDSEEEENTQDATRQRCPVQSFASQALAGTTDGIDRESQPDLGDIFSAAHNCENYLESWNSLQRARSQLSGKRTTEVGGASLDEFTTTRSPMAGSELCDSNMLTGGAFCSESGPGSLKATEADSEEEENTQDAISQTFPVQSCASQAIDKTTDGIDRES